MIRFILLTCTLILLSACSSKTPKNEWQFNSINAYESYNQYFLKDEVNLANLEIKRAQKYAKQSADLHTLTQIYLSQCALHVAVLEDDTCQEYLNVENLSRSDEDHSYYLFLQHKLTKDDIKQLPSKYRKFAQYALIHDYKNAQKEILDMDNIVSKMIAASLIKESLENTTMKNIIDEASFYGYKKAVINWLRFYLTKVKDKKEKKLIEKKLQVIND